MISLGAYRDCAAVGEESNGSSLIERDTLSAWKEHVLGAEDLLVDTR